MWVPDGESEATVGDETNHRSYRVKTDEGTYRRNRRAIIRLPGHSSQETSLPDPELTSSQEASDQYCRSTL